MDVPRTNVIAQRRRRRIYYVVAGILVGFCAGIAFWRLKPAAPEVERATVWLDTVRRGSMIRQVHGIGNLTPLDIRWIPALADGRVERILVRPGAAVHKDTVLVELSNPQVQQAALDAQYQLHAAEADLASLEVQLQSQFLSQRADAAKVEAEFNEARMKADADVELAKLGVISSQNLKISESNARQLEIRADIERQRTANTSRELQARIAAQRAKVQQAKAQSDLAQQRLESMRIRAGNDGVLQELSLNNQPLQVGQQVSAGTTIAKVADPLKLKAELGVAETEAKDLTVGLTAQVDTHNGVVSGKVVRIDPAVQNGKVAVDVELIGELPHGARPDLTVDGSIDLESLSNVLYVGRPAFGQENGAVSMFRMESDGVHATRTQVKFGRGSVNAIQILGGLKEGDQVILSDMSRWADSDRVRLE